MVMRLWLVKIQKTRNYGLHLIMHQTDGLHRTHNQNPNPNPSPLAQWPFSPIVQCIVQCNHKATYL